MLRFTESLRRRRPTKSEEEEGQGLLQVGTRTPTLSSGTDLEAARPGGRGAAGGMWQCGVQRVAAGEGSMQGLGGEHSLAGTGTPCSAG